MAGKMLRGFSPIGKTGPLSGKVLREYLFITVGVFLTALGLDMFLIPNKIAAGGVSGIGTIVYYVSDSRIPVGLTMLALNVPLFLAGIKGLGMRFGVRSLYGTVTLSIFVDVLAKVVVVPTQNDFLASLYGGILTGIGLGLVFRNKGTTGGTDLAAALVNKFAGMRIGMVLFSVDGAVIVAAGLVFGLEPALYALITVFLTGQVIDIVQEGLGYAKAAIIISDRIDEISQRILTDLDRGATTLFGRGAYTGEDRQVLLSVVTRAQLSRLKEIVHEIDPGSFVIVTDVHEVLGEGFKTNIG